MFAPILSGLVVSVDAFFIGISLGLQKKCRFSWIVFTNVFLLGLCAAGFLLAERLYEHIPFNPDLVVGFTFIALGTWCILSYFRSRHEQKEHSRATFVIVGVVMSVEAMLITMGVTFVFGEAATWAVPATIAAAHFGYSALAFHLARMRRLRRIPAVVSHVVSGAALVVYGLMSILG
jgi:putative Mn2+ efflux pump MntP